MKYISKPSGSFTDRKETEPNLEPIDVIIPTLDADNFLERCLYTVFKEIPVRKLFICDGGSKDKTVEILKKFPRVELHVRPDIRTTGKSLEFLISLVKSNWFVLMDSDLELDRSWYDKIIKHKKEYDVIENSKVVLAYHMYREDKFRLDPDARSSGMCHLVKKEAVQNYRCDDDYMWRFTDYLFRQSVEESGYKYGKISSTHYVHNETERIQYKSDDEKNFQKIVLTEPKYVIIDKAKAEKYNLKHAKAIVKYLDPQNTSVRKNKGFSNVIKLLDRKWIEEHGPKWLEIYDKRNLNSSRYTLRKFLSKIKNRK